MLARTYKTSIRSRNFLEYNRMDDGISIMRFIFLTKEKSQKLTTCIAYQTSYCADHHPWWRVQQSSLQARPTQNTAATGWVVNRYGCSNKMIVRKRSGKFVQESTTNTWSACNMRFTHSLFKNRSARSMVRASSAKAAAATGSPACLNILPCERADRIKISNTTQNN